MRNRAIISLSISIYLPSLLVQMGMAMTSSFDPLWSKFLGADVAMIGLIATGMGIGLLLFDLPSGWLGGRVKSKTFLIVSLIGLIVSALLRAIATAPWQLLLIAVLLGMSLSAWGIGLVAYLRRNVPSEFRGRTMAFMGGMMRIARIITPAIGGAIVQFTGFRMLYAVQTLLYAVALLVLIVLLKEEENLDSDSKAAPGILRELFAKNWKTIVSAMIGLGGLQLLRISKSLVFPLWADHIGVSAIVLGAITSGGGLLETAMVFPAGLTLDKMGRKWVAVPCTLGFALSLALLPLAASIPLLVLIYALMSISNGFGSGINMTISSDLAPRQAASEFLGIWRFVTDTSILVGPLIAGFIAASLSLWAAPVVAAAIGFGSGMVLLFGMTETRPPEKERTSD